MNNGIGTSVGHIYLVYSENTDINVITMGIWQSQLVGVSQLSLTLQGMIWIG
jgi:hypothetical protein